MGVGRLGRVRRGGAPPPGSGCQLANFPVCWLFDFSTCWKVGELENWRSGAGAGTG